MVGKLSVITGPMASGKTLELIRLLKRREIGGADWVLYKHSIDTRDGINESGSRMGLKIKAIPVTDSKILYKNFQNFNRTKDIRKVVAIEEAHIFDEDLFQKLIQILDTGTDVYLTCLNQDFRGEPFGHRYKKKLVPRIMASADNLISLTAVCANCGGEATKTQRLVTTGSPNVLIQIGGDESYEPRCVNCWVRPNE